MKSRTDSVAVILISIFVLGCSSKERDVGPRMQTTPLSGIVEVDGEPKAGVTVECHPESGSSEMKSALFATTEEDGSFSFGLYKTGGGVPAGKYKLVFKWEEFGNANKDKFKGAYADPKKSKFDVTVVEGEPQAIDLIELSTKGPH